MKRIHPYHIVAILLVFVSTLSCKQTKDKVKEITLQQNLPDSKVSDVTTAPLLTTSFNYELISNGKITARNVAELQFQTSEIITNIFVKNGDKVRVGDRIAQLDTFRLHNRLVQASDALERSTLEVQDLLIGQGYKLNKMDEVPADVIHIVQVKSNYNNSLQQYYLAEQELKQATLTTPISGTIANLTSKSYSKVNTSEPFCLVVGSQEFEASFKVLENELGLIEKGNSITAIPFALPELKVKGKIVEINPWVDDNGMVAVKATVVHHPRLVEGMNIRISTLRSIPNKWVIPKSAVVLRTNKQVVFVHSNGKALWNYVETELENIDSYTITSKTLKEGDEIITSGNINLAHESPVNVISNQKKTN